MILDLGMSLYFFFYLIIEVIPSKHGKHKVLTQCLFYVVVCLDLISEVRVDCHDLVPRT